MITIKDYKFLCHLEAVLVSVRDILITYETDEAKLLITAIDKDLFQLRKIIDKLENADE